MAGKGKRSFGSIRQLPSRNGPGRWQANYTGPDGSIHKAPHTFGAKIDAEAWLTDRRREIDRGRWSPNVDDDEAPTFRAFAEQFLATRQVAGRPLRPRTKAHYRAMLDGHLLPTFGDVELTMISAESVRRWYAGLLPNKDSMRAQVYSLLRTILNEAVRQELIASNPARITGASTAKRATKTKPASIDELGTLTAAMEPPRLRPMILLGSWASMRFGEIVELRRKDLEFGGEDGAEWAVVRIRRQAVRVGGTYEIGPPKSDAGIRDVHLPPHMVPVLREHLAEHVGKGGHALLFPSLTDPKAHLQPSTFNKHYYIARKAAGRNDLRFHDLRHTGAVLLAQSGATLADLMARLGHSTPTAAMRYQWAAQGRDRKLAEGLSKLIDDPNDEG